MKYEGLEGYSDELFRRLTGVKRKTFEKMVGILQEAEKIKKRQGGKPARLRIEDRLLMTLEYLREYRTYFHVSFHFQFKRTSSGGGLADEIVHEVQRCGASAIRE